MYRQSLVRVLAMTVLFWVAQAAFAQVVREQGAVSIAGVLYKGANGWKSDSFSFTSFGDEILVADLDAELFMSPGESGGCGESSTDSTGGCSGDTGGCASEGGGGSGQFTLKVLDSSGATICQAGRPTRPGWERDPRIACHIQSPGGYVLEVGRGPMGGESSGATGAGSGGHVKLVYLLNISLRKVAVSGPMIQSITGSRSAFPRQN